MNYDIFAIDNFNIIQDEDNYYFFRALNNADNFDIEDNITTDEFGNIIKVRTDRERYEDIPKYSKDSKISLEEIFDHIKMHHRMDTNCISLSSNTNVSILYGREYYKDRYIMVRVPKSELGENVINAPQYMILEINKRISNFINNNELSDEVKNYLSAIEDANNQEELKLLVNSIIKDKDKLRDSMFQKGIEYISMDTTSVDYQALTKEQNLEKDKLIAKVNIIGKKILPKVSNRFLIQTIGNAFSSLELIHYKDIEKEELIELPKEIIDIFSLLQQLDADYPRVKELKQELLNIVLNGKYNIEEFNYQTYQIDTDNDYTIEKMYNLSKGNVDFERSINLYKKSFYLAKSKLRTISMINLLDKLTNKNLYYQEIFDYLVNNTYGVEPIIFSKLNSNKLQVSESVNMDFNQKEQELFDFVNKLQIEDLEYIINRPLEALEYYLDNFKSIEHNNMTKEEYYANAIIDLFDWSKLNVEKIYPEQRNDIVKKLIENNVVGVYEYLKKLGVKEVEISNALLTTVIKKKKLKYVNLDDSFTVNELEDFLGYYKIKGTDLELKPYQVVVKENIDEILETKQFTTAILPTGSGKSFVALAKMLEYKNENILYLAPNVEILNQIKKYARIYLYGTKNTTGISDDEILRRVFPNITISTYANLKEEGAQDIINGKYSFIVLDELHRTGAKEWHNYVKKILDNQDENTKVLGITATSQRDVDFNNMADYWAEYYGYTEEEIAKQKHIAINMDIIQGIKLGYIVNPKIVNCEYSLIKDGKLDNLYEKINSIQDENKRKELLQRYETLRRNIDKCDGIEKILQDNFKSDGKYIVFLPINRKDNGTYEDEDGNLVSKDKAERIIQTYQTQMKQYLFSGEYLKENASILEIIYYKINNNDELSYDLLEYLNQEKENILLLSKINNIKNNNTLVTKTNEIADLIIKKMNWTPLKTSEKGKILNKKTKDIVECYSMLGSYSNKKNNRELNNFSSTASNKLKLMFVMNKLNEGVHVDGIDGIIWLRPMDENSKILFLQQLGRCIYGVDPNEDILDEKRPIVIDFVNNSLTVNLVKGDLPEIKDLNALKIIENYINIHNGLVLDINSKNVEELYYLKTLNRLKNKYSKYFDDITLLDKLDYKKRNVINEIIELGSNIDLWNMELSKIKQLNKSSNKSYLKNEEIDLFTVNGILRDFVDLSEDVEKYNLSFQNKLEEYIEKLNNGYIPKYKDKDEMFK